MFSAAKTSGPSGGYTLTKSLRFRSNASATLSRTPSVASNRTTWTWSAWVKLGLNNLSSSPAIFQAGYNTAPWTVLLQNTDGSLQIAYSAGSAVGTNTNAVLKDPSAWYHLVWVTDTTQATASNRMKFYINGVQASFSSTNYPAQNFSTPVNNTVAHTLGGWSSQYFDGYLAEVNFIDGQALTASSFGAFSATTGVWQPIKYTGTYGTNGFHLPFTNTTSTTTLGYDTSGNGNNWTTNNISLTAGSTYDSMNDVPNVASATAANYAVCNLADTNTNITLSNGNLAFTGTTGSWYAGRQTIGMTSGKWYWEVYCNSISSSPDYRALIGIMSSQGSLASFVGSDAYGWGYYSSGGDKYHNGSGGGGYGASFGTGDTIGIAFDAGAGTLTFYKNGTSQGVAYTSIPSSTYFPALSVYGNTAQVSANFGQQPFAYTPPSGFVALNTYNIPTGTVTTSGSFTGNASSVGPFVYLNGIPTAMTINGNSVTFGTHANKLSNGFQVITSSSSYNSTGTNTFSVSTTGNVFQTADAQTNP